MVGDLPGALVDGAGINQLNPLGDCGVQLLFARIRDAGNQRLTHEFMSESERIVGSLGAGQDYSHLLRFLDRREEFVNIDPAHLSQEAEAELTPDHRRSRQHLHFVLVEPFQTAADDQAHIFEVPENVRLIIGRRLERFDENEMQVLAAAAMIGRKFSFRLLTQVSRVDVDELFTAIEKAQQMGIILPSAEGPDNPFAFAHELVRQTLIAGISDPRKQQLHAAVAEGIELVYPGAVNERAREVADHLIKAGSFADQRKLLRWLKLAGRSALRVASFEEARRNSESALSHKGVVEAQQRAELLVSLARAERGLDLWDAAIAHLREVLEIYIELDDREMSGRSFTELAAASIWVGRFQEAAETARRGLTYLQGEVSADRARLLATLAQALAAAGVYQAADDAVREALKIASQRSDSRLEARLLNLRSIIDIQFLRLREAVQGGLPGKQPGGSELPPWEFVLELLILHQEFLYLGRPQEALRIADELEPLANKIGQSLSLAFCLSTRAWIEFGKDPDLAKLEADFQRVRRSEREASFAHLEVFFEVQLSLVDFFRGNWISAPSHIQASRRGEPRSSMDGLGAGAFFRQAAYAGDRDGALAILDEARDLLPRSGEPNAAGSWLMLALAIEGLVMLGEHSQAGELYPLVRELLDTGPVVLWPIFRLTHTIAGIAASAGRQWKTAEEHFQIAMQLAESLPDRLEQAEIRRFHAMMLIDRDAPGDRVRARTLLGEASESYTQIGMPRHVEMTEALLAR